MFGFVSPEWPRSPAILVGERELLRLTTAALVDATRRAEEVDFLLYEVEGASVIDDEALPSDIVRLDSVVRYRSGRVEWTIKLVLPDASAAGNRFRLSVTSMHGAALLGLSP